MVSLLVKNISVHFSFRIQPLAFRAVVLRHTSAYVVLAEDFLLVLVKVKDSCQLSHRPRLELCLILTEIHTRAVIVSVPLLAKVVEVQSIIFY